MKQKGFTLIELLVTMGIIAVLTGLSIFNFNQSRVRARDVQRKSDLGQLMKAVELYKNDQGSYPPESTGFQTVLQSNEYIKKLFTDPKGDVDWRAYEYKVDSYGGYYLMACLENKADTAKTTNTTLCNLFIDLSSCTCGPGNDPVNRIGTMYIVSNK